MLCAAAGWGCGFGSAMRPDDPRADDLEECRTVSDRGTPLVVDLRSHERSDLELAMGTGQAA